MTAVDLVQLQAELEAGGVPVPFGLGTLDGTKATVHTYTSSGAVATLPPAADPIVAAHVAPPAVVEYVETRAVSAVTRTTDGAFHEIWRLATSSKHTYRAVLEMGATDATNGTHRAQQAVLVFKGQAGSVVQVGTTTVLWSAPDPGTTTWAIQAQVQGTDLVFGVRGAAGATLDWSLSGQVVVFAPGGLGG